MSVSMQLQAGRKHVPIDKKNYLNFNLQSPIKLNKSTKNLAIINKKKFKTPHNYTGHHKM